MANIFPLDSPEISPKKTTTTESNLVPQGNPFLSPNKSNLVHEKVAKLTIHESQQVGPLQSSKDFTSKRRRSSAALINHHDESMSRKNSLTNMKVIKKKKKMNKPLSIKIYESSLNKKISIKDIRDLTLFLMNGTNNMPQWLRIKNRPIEQKMVVLFMPGLEPQDFGLDEHDKFSQNIPKDNQLFIQGNKNIKLLKNWQTVPVTAPGSRLSLFSSYNSFINVGLTKNEKLTKREQLAKKKITINDLMMSLDQLLENGYPIHPKTEGINTEDMRFYSNKQHENNEEYTWYNTIDFEHSGSHIFGLDCEMCLADKDSVLTRVSILDFQNNVIYDKLVKPDVPITDYLTRYSGITKEKLDPITTTLSDVQHDIIKLIGCNDILIGHSLQSDLLALKLRHPKIVDTAVIFDHKAGPPFKPALKYLASEYLHIDIQNQSDDGHDSIEDARTCIELTKLKILNGLSFGISINTENLFFRIGERAEKKTLILNDYVSKNLNSLEWNTSTKLFYSKLRCVNDTEIYDNILANISSFDLFIGRLREMEFNRSYSPRPDHLKPFIEKTDKEILENFNSHINKIYDSLPFGSVILIISGCGDTKDFNKIMGELNKVNKEERVKVKQEKESILESAVEKARDSVASIIFKTESYPLEEKSNDNS